MLKALLVVHGIMGMDPYQVPMENMSECNKAAIQVLQQDDELKVLCLPAKDKQAEAQQQIDTMFNFFNGFITKMREQQDDYCYERPFDESCPVQSFR